MARKDIATADKLLHSTADAAAILDMGKETLVKLVNKNVIPRIEVRGDRKFYIGDLHDFCKEMRNKKINPEASAEEIIRNLT